MTDSFATALLPAGLHDLLPLEAEREAGLVERAMGVFRLHGYDRVKPPLVEFEESLLAGVGRALAQQTFRVLDPDSQRMMGLRADMTLQIARIASSRLARAPRPVRLCYAGEVLRVTGAPLMPERQRRQIGCELIGSLEAAADSEIVLVAARALSELGVVGLSIDLNVPTLVPTIFRAACISGDREHSLTTALARRDMAAVSADRSAGPLLAALIDAAGPAQRAVARLETLRLPEAAEPDRNRLIETIRAIQAAEPTLTLTVDPVERRGFEYQTGVSFTLFARGARRELGRGGRYRIGNGTAGNGPGDALTGEPAVGFSLFADAVLSAAPAEAPGPRVYVPANVSTAAAARLRSEGWITVAGLSPVADAESEAERLGCDHVLTDLGEPRKLLSSRRV